jgi:hypothetical protein
MKEEFLHFIWKNRLFDSNNLKTVDGNQVEVVDPGDYNRDSGPDFFNSRIIIDNTEWAGNVEIHLLSSHWHSHGHHKDHAYDNVILHVVWKHDYRAFTASGQNIETLEITWDKSISNRYEEYISKPYTIACSGDIQKVETIIIRQWINRLAVQRLLDKSDRIKVELEETCNDWEEVLYRLLSKYFGMNVNSDPFYLLSKITPLSIIRKHISNPVQVEALLFGQAGMLHKGLFLKAVDDDYYRLLVREYSVLSAKYSLVPMDGWTWKFHRMRPANFPTIRISQLANLLLNHQHLFSLVKMAGSYQQLSALFDCGTSIYWQSHYTFGKEVSRKEKRVGDSAISGLIINCLLPLLFLYGRENSDQDYCERAIDIAENMSPEQNLIVKEWAKAGIKSFSAFESQGLLELKERFCKNRACLNCHIGTKLISLSKDSDPRERLILEDPKT